jgi:hypothetical protein
MNGDKIVSVFGSLVVLAMITTLVLPGRGTASVISSFFNGFNGSIRAGING